MGDNGKCLSAFTSFGYKQCVMNCSKTNGFENRSENGNPFCVYKSDPTLKVELTQLPVYYYTPIPAKYITDCGNEQSRVESELAKILNNLGKSQQIQDAFKQLQEAENIRDKVPENYQTARYNYYTLLKGESWKEEETARLEKAEVEPEINKFNDSISELTGQIFKQKQMIESIKNVKDKVLSVKDEFQYSVDTLSKQLDTVQAKLVLEKRKTEEKQEDDWSSWIHFALNVLIVIILASIGFIVYKILIKKRFERTYEPPTQIQIV